MAQFNRSIPYARGTDELQNLAGKTPQEQAEILQESELFYVANRVNGILDGKQSEEGDLPAVTEIVWEQRNYQTIQAQLKSVFEAIKSGDGGEVKIIAQEIDPTISWAIDWINKLLEQKEWSVHFASKACSALAKIWNLEALQGAMNCTEKLAEKHAYYYAGLAYLSVVEFSNSSDIREMATRKVLEMINWARYVREDSRAGELERKLREMVATLPQGLRVEAPEYIQNSIDTSSPGATNIAYLDISVAKVDRIYEWCEIPEWYIGAKGWFNGFGTRDNSVLVNELTSIKSTLKGLSEARSVSGEQTPSEEENRLMARMQEIQMEFFKFPPSSDFVVQSAGGKLEKGALLLPRHLPFYDPKSERAIVVDIEKSCRGIAEIAVRDFPEDLLVTMWNLIDNTQTNLQNKGEDHPLVEVFASLWIVAEEKIYTREDLKDSVYQEWLDQKREQETAFVNTHNLFMVPEKMTALVRVPKEYGVDPVACPPNSMIPKNCEYCLVPRFMTFPLKNGVTITVDTSETFASPDMFDILWSISEKLKNATVDDEKALRNLVLKQILQHYPKYHEWNLDGSYVYLRRWGVIDVRGQKIGVKSTEAMLNGCGKDEYR